MKHKPRRYPSYLRSVSRGTVTPEPQHPAVLIGMGTYRYPNPRTMGSVWKMLQHFHGAQQKYVAALQTVTATALPVMRANCCRTMMEMPNVEALLFVDDDMDFPVGIGVGRDGKGREGFNPLAYLLSLDKDVVGALCFSRDHEIRPFVGFEDEAGRSTLKIQPAVLQSGEPFRVDFIGFGMVLIRRHVIEAMLGLLGHSIDAMFRSASNWRLQAETKLQFSQALELYRAGTYDDDDLAREIDQIQAQAESLGEDYTFCRLAREAGCEIWCAPKFDCIHYGDYGYGRLDWEAKLAFAKREQEEAHESTGP